MKVRITDNASFYNGKIAKVMHSTCVSGITVFWVAVPDNIEFAVRADNTEDVFDGV